MDQRLISLREKHAALEAKLEDEYMRPCPDAYIIANLKREKLSIKDEIHGIRRH